MAAVPICYPTTLDEAHPMAHSALRLPIPAGTKETDVEFWNHPLLAVPSSLAKGKRTEIALSKTYYRTHSAYNIPVKLVPWAPTNSKESALFMGRTM